MPFLLTNLQITRKSSGARATLLLTILLQTDTDSNKDSPLGQSWEAGVLGGFFFGFDKTE